MSSLRVSVRTRLRYVLVSMITFTIFVEAVMLLGQSALRRTAQNVINLFRQQNLQLDGRDREGK